jgi:hypothetical protein
VYAVAGNEIAAGGQFISAPSSENAAAPLDVCGGVGCGPYNAVALHMIATLWILADGGGVLIGRGLFDARTGLMAAALYGYAAVGSAGTTSRSTAKSDEPADRVGLRDCLP